MVRIQKELIRGKILYCLALVYPKAATLPLLQGELDIVGYPVPTDELKFHLAYLEEKGMVSVEEPGSLQPRRKVALVKITAKGIDYQDGRLPLDEGVQRESER